ATMNALAPKCRREAWHFPPTIMTSPYSRAGRESCAAPGKSAGTFSIRADTPPRFDLVRAFSNLSGGARQNQAALGPKEQRHPLAFPGVRRAAIGLYHHHLAFRAVNDVMHLGAHVDDVDDTAGQQVLARLGCQ